MPDPVIDPAATWFTGADPDLLGHIQNRGWDTKPVNEVALEAARSHRELERLRGVPAEQLVRWPKDQNDAEHWGQVYERLGVPKDATGYDLTGVKFADGSELSEDFVTTMRATAATLHLPAEAVKGVAAAVAKYMDDADAREETTKQGTLIEQKQALAANWGKNAEANLFVAKNTATALGVTAEQITALEGVIGYDKVMEMFRAIGEKTGEAKYTGNGAPGGDGAKTAEQAQAEKANLMNDAEWRKSYLDGNVDKAKQMTTLDTIIWSAKPEHINA